MNTAAKLAGASPDELQKRNAEVQEKYAGKRIILDQTKSQVVPRDVPANTLVLESSFKDQNARICGPGARVTRDYQPSRLNIVHDEHGNISRAYYG